MRGAITIELSQIDSQVQLIVADDGIGLSHDPMHTNTRSLGMQLIKGLTRDLNGIVFFEVDHGTKITLRFPVAHAVTSSSYSPPSETIIHG